MIEVVRQFRVIPMAHNEVISRLESFTDSVEFERFCCDILTRAGHKGLEPQGTGRVDGGRDAVLVSRSGESVYSFSLRKDWNKKFKEDLQTVLSRNLLCPGHTFVFASNRHIPPLTRNKLRNEVRNEHGCELDVWDQERLRTFLEGSATDLIEKYLGVRRESASASAHLSQIQREVLIPILQSYRDLVASIQLQGPVIMVDRRASVTPRKLLSSLPQVDYEYDLAPWPCTFPTGTLFEDASEHHFKTEIDKALSVRAQHYRIIKPSIELALELAARMRRIFPKLPDPVHSLDGRWLNTIGLGAMIVNKAIGAYGGAYQLMDNGGELINPGSGTIYMRAEEALRIKCKNLADLLTLDPSTQRICAQVTKKLEALSKRATAALRALERAALRMSLPGVCELV